MARSEAYDRHPQHKLAIAPEPVRVRVRLGETVIAESERALRLDEGTYPPVYYVPREDADLAYYERTEHSTHCPFKGDASYFTLRAGDRVEENAVWSYEDPFDQMAALRDHLAFYTDRVTLDVEP